MLDHGNYKAVHNHASRPLRDAKGNYVRVPIPGKFWGKVQATRIVTVPFTECDLPEDPRKDEGYCDGCHWTYTSTWINSGDARCGCDVCSGNPQLKRENRSKRYAGKRYVRGAWRDEY